MGPVASPAGKMPETADLRPLPSGSPTAGLSDRWLVPGVCIFLAAVIWVVFGRTLGYNFVNYDDERYVYENSVVQKGLTGEGFRWAFTHVCSANWHPLTWLSHMLDCQLYGLNAGGHHLTSVLLHTATAILLFLVLRRMTGFLWRSAFVAAVFAIHPLRVESVAWVAERKDVLSGLFFMLTLWAYARYVQRQARVEAKMARLWTLDYGLVVLLFALGLMCKPMLVTLPFVLLLLDCWPLGRVAGGGWRVTGEKKEKPSTLNCNPNVFGAPFLGATKQSEDGSTLLLEKLPLLGLAVASCVVTIFAQHEALQSFENMSLPLLMGNALISCVAYLGQMFWPSGLAVLYPFTAGSVGVSKVVLSLVLLAGISGGVFVLRRRAYFLTGWLWYLIMLAPVIGIVQVGPQARADRYTYLPQIGLYLLLTWAAADLCAGWRHRRVVLGVTATAILTALIVCARAQTAYWQNSESLWTHTLACTSDNLIAHNNLGVVLLQKGDVDGAVVHFQQALQIKPDSVQVHNNLGLALKKQGHIEEAMEQYDKSIQINPNNSEAQYNLGLALADKGRFEEAIEKYRQAIQISPNYSEALSSLGAALVAKGRFEEAIECFRQAIQVNPNFSDALFNLGVALAAQGRFEEAIKNYRQAIQINPKFSDALSNLGVALAAQGRFDEAIENYRQAIQINPKNSDALYNLGLALAVKGRFDEAIENYRQAIQANANRPETFFQLGMALGQLGRTREAAIQYREALKLNPNLAGALNNLAWVLAASPDDELRNGAEAVRLAERACELTHSGEPLFLGTLAAAYAEAGRFPEAVTTAEKAEQLATAAGSKKLAESIRRLLEFYRAGKPYHRPAPTGQ